MLYEKIRDLINKGYSHRQIAKELDIGVATVSDIRNAKTKKAQIQKSFLENKPTDNVGVERIKPFVVQQTDVDEDMSDLEKAIDRLAKKGIYLQVHQGFVNKHTSQALPPFTGGDINNVLVISDLHAPYILDGYLAHCREQQEKFNCGTVIYIGDIIDFHSISYHEKIPEELNPAGEMALARIQLKDWYHTFPNATVLLGNHDLLIYRQARTAGLLREFIKDPNSIFEAPKTYKFVDELIVNDVLYTHGSTSDAWKKCILENMNMVSGHAHTKCGIMFHQNRHGQLWGMQVGVGIDYSNQAFDYAKYNSKYPVSACGIVLNSGKLPIVLPFYS